MRCALLLQGPIGPYFRHLARELTDAGWQVLKVNFNGGDEYFFPERGLSGASVHPFRKSLQDWPSECERILTTYTPDRIYLFGDCRPVHRIAREIAAKLGIPVFVFEEGYVRPNHVTLEEGGVNAYSQMPRVPEFYRELPEVLVGHGASVPEVKHAFYWSARHAIRYYLASARARRSYPHDLHHRPLDPLTEGARWIRAVFRKLSSIPHDRKVFRQAVGALAGRYFLVSLQVHNDSQVKIHSTFGTVERFVQHVLVSFAQSAPPEARLIIKHHPMDRAYSDYRGLVDRLSTQMGIDGRVLCIDDGHLPTLIRHSRGMVVINSTSGISALHHGMPVVTLGRSFYDVPGLTHQGGLEDFWVQPQAPCMSLYARFRAWMVRSTQLAGSFYRPDRFPSLANAIDISLAESARIKEEGAIEHEPIHQRLAV